MAVSASGDQVGLTPLSGFGLNSHPNSGPTVVTSQAQVPQTQMQIPQDLVMKLLQVQQVCQFCCGIFVFCFLVIGVWKLLKLLWSQWLLKNVLTVNVFETAVWGQNRSELACFLVHTFS
jgi:hypothetical protein